MILVILEQICLAIYCKIVFINNLQNHFQIENLEQFSVNMTSITLVAFLMNMMACMILRIWYVQLISLLALEYLIFNYWTPSEITVQILLVAIAYIFYHLDKRHRMFINEIY